MITEISEPDPCQHAKANANINILERNSGFPFL